VLKIAISAAIIILYFISMLHAYSMSWHNNTFYYKLRIIEAENPKKLRTASLNSNLLVLMKKYYSWHYFINITSLKLLHTLPQSTGI